MKHFYFDPCLHSNSCDTLIFERIHSNTFLSYYYPNGIGYQKTTFAVHNFQLHLTNRNFCQVFINGMGAHYFKHSWKINTLLFATRLRDIFFKTNDSNT